MKKQIWAGIFAGIMIAGMSFTAYAGQWESDSTGYWYREDDGSYLSDVWKMIGGKWYHFNEQGYMESDTWIGDYYVGTDGALWTHALTKEGYWLDGSGKKDENKRIYGDCVFKPTSYKKEGDRFEITGVICDTGYMAQEEIDRMSVGAVIAIPDVHHSYKVCELTEEARVSGFEPSYNDGRRTIVVREPFYDEYYGGMQTGMYEYYLNSKEMWGWCPGSMEWPVYRIVQKNITLIADAGTEFVVEADYVSETSLEKCLKEWIDLSIANYGKIDDFKILVITLTGNHIDRVVNPIANYVG